MRRNSKFFVVTALFLSLGLVWSACGGGGGGGTPAFTFSSPEQAAKIPETAGDLVMTVGSWSDVIFDEGFGWFVAAPGRQKKAPSTDSMSKLDPRLKAFYDRVVNNLKSPTLQNAVKKAKALAAMKSEPINQPGTCLDGGTYTYTGTNYSDETYNPWLDVTLTFDNCKELGTVTTGSIRLTEKFKIDGTSGEGSLTFSNYTIKYYENAYTTLSSTDVYNGTFTGNWTDDGTIGDSIDTANATLKTTYADGSIWTVSLNNIRGEEDWLNNSNFHESTEKINGSFKFTVSFSGVTAGFGISASNYTYKERYTFSTSTLQEWYNGRVVMDWIPDNISCIEGAFDISTPDNDPLTYQGTICPISGTLRINNATLVYDNGSVDVTVGSVTTPYTSCSDMGWYFCGVI